MKGYIRADLRVYHLSQIFFFKLGNSMKTLCQQEKHNWLSKNLGASSKAVLLLLFYISNKNSDITD